MYVHAVSTVSPELEEANSGVRTRAGAAHSSSLSPLG